MSWVLIITIFAGAGGTNGGVSTNISTVGFSSEDRCKKAAEAYVKAARQGGEITPVTVCVRL